MTDREKLIQIRGNLLAQAEDINRFLDGVQISIISAKVVGDRVRIGWASDSAGEFDFQWYNTEYQQPWQNSRTKWTPGEFPDLSDETHEFGLNPGRDKSHDDKWKVRAVTLSGDPLTEAVDVESEEPEPEKPDWKPEFEATTGKISGCYGIRGIEDDTTLQPPSLNPADWELLNNGNPIVHYEETVGKQKIDPVGFYLSKSGLCLLYNSGWNDYTRWHELRDERGYAGARTQAGSLYAFNDDFTEKKEYRDSPVLDRPQTWQGNDRVNPYALVYNEIDNHFYCFYGDFRGNYSGIRALGVARSKDMIQWEYVSKDRPMLDVKRLYNEVEGKALPNNRFDREGRLYAFGATWMNNQIYLTVGGSIDGDNFTIQIRSRDVMDYWKLVRDEQSGRPQPIEISSKFYRPQNIRHPDDPNQRAIALAVGERISDIGDNHFIFGTGMTGSAGTSRQLFAYKGKWHVAYRQRDEKKWNNNEGDFRSMYIAREK